MFWNITYKINPTVFNLKKMIKQLEKKLEKEKSKNRDNIKTYCILRTTKR